MAPDETPSRLDRRRVALFALFALPGFAIASWVVRTPDIRTSIHASTEQMGLVLFGVSIGSVLGILASTPLIKRFGARAITGVAMTCIVISMPVVGFGAELGDPGVVTFGLCLFGLGMGGSEIAINSEAAAIETAAGIAVLPAMHGCFSLGTVVGAVAGVGCNVASVAVGTHLVIVGVVGTPVLASQIRHLSSSNGSMTSGTRREARSPRLWRDQRLLFVSVIVLTMALAEGAAIDWLPLVMVDGHGMTAAGGSMVFVAFSAAMAVGRFSGAYFLTRFSRAAVFRVSASTAAVGIACTALIDNLMVAVVAVALWGLGVSLGFPVAISAAGDSGVNSVQRVSFVTTMGYLAFLVGPPSLGVIGEDFGLRQALLAPLCLVVVAILLAPALAPARRGRPRKLESVAPTR